MISSARSISSRVIVSAGVSVRMFPMVSLKLSPRLRAAYITASASSAARSPVVRSFTSSMPKKPQAADVADQRMAFHHFFHPSDGVCPSSRITCQTVFLDVADRGEGRGAGDGALS